MARSRRRARRRARGLARSAVVAAVLVGGVLGVVTLLDRHDRAPLAVRCGASADGTSWYLQPEQADNAALIALFSVRLSMPARAATIALATAMQESGLRNLDHGDRDSLGLFQQRPSQGWGTAEEVRDPVHATTAFYTALAKVDGYQDLPVTKAAQAVQRSAFPDAYAAHEASARAWASALTGYSPTSLTCTLGPAAAPADPAAVIARVDRDLGVPAALTPADPAAGRPATVTVQAAELPGAAQEPGRLSVAVAQWAVATALPLGLDEVRVGDATWSRASGAWSVADGQQGTAARPPVPAGQVVLVLAG